MTDKIYCVTDLGPGDGGKGGVVHFLANRFRPHTIVKEGGAQGSHGVITSRGEKFNFSQWGCGTLDGIPTHLSERFVISPTGLLNEATGLERLGLHNPFQLLTVSPGCLLATPFHQSWSRLEELLLKDHPRGTVGTGVGRAFRQSKRNAAYSLYAEDLTRMTEHEIQIHLETVRDFIYQKFRDKQPTDFLEADRTLAEQSLELLRDPDGLIVRDIAAKFFLVGQQLKLKELGEVLKKDGSIVVERSHGVLTDNIVGFSPHVSAFRTLPSFSVEMSKRAGYTGEFKHIGVHRAYEIRHGAGPMPTARENWLKDAPGSHKDENRWQGKVRFGPLDTVLLQYALWSCRETPFDCLALTWFDQPLSDGVWTLAHRYYDRQGHVLARTYDSRQGSIFMDYKTLQDLPLNIEKVASCECIDVPLNSYGLRREPEKCIELASDILSVFVDVPVRMVSLGPTEQDKYII